jgi:hypothetical protein
MGFPLFRLNEFNAPPSMPNPMLGVNYPYTMPRCSLSFLKNVEIALAIGCFHAKTAQTCRHTRFVFSSAQITSVLRPVVVNARQSGNAPASPQLTEILEQKCVNHWSFFFPKSQ